MNVSLGKPKGKLIGTIPWSSARVRRAYALMLAGKIKPVSDAR